MRRFDHVVGRSLLGDYAVYLMQDDGSIKLAQADFTVDSIQR